MERLTTPVEVKHTDDQELLAESHVNQTVDKIVAVTNAAVSDDIADLDQTSLDLIIYRVGRALGDTWKEDGPW